MVNNIGYIQAHREKSLLDIKVSHNHMKILEIDVSILYFEKLEFISISILLFVFLIFNLAIISDGIELFFIQFKVLVPKFISNVKKQ